MRKRVVANLCIVVLVFSMISTVAGAKETEQYQDDFAISREVQDMLDEQAPAIHAYEEILEGLGITIPSDPMYPNYPDEYGGAYYQDKQLYICLTEDTANNREKYLSLITDDSVVRFITVDHSYNDLYELSLQVAESYGATISSVGVDIKENAVDIGVQENLAARTMPAIVESIESTISRNTSIPIQYSYEEKASSSATELIGGKEITGGTMTISGTWQGKNAILTAGHCVTVGNTYRYEGSKVGTGVYTRYETEQFYDYGVIEVTESGFTSTNKVLNNVNATTITSTLRSSSGLVGTSVCKYGKVEDFGVATIKKVDAVVSYNKGPTLYGMSKAEFTSGTGYKGDSGGPIYLEHKLYGIYSGDDADKDDRTKTATYFWYSPIYGAAGFTVKTSS